MHHALVPLDGSAFGRRALQTACRLLDPAAYRVTLLHVAPLPAGYTAPLPAVMLEAWTSGGPGQVDGAVAAYGEAALERFRTEQLAHLEPDLACLEQAGFSVSLAAEFGDPATGILRFARAQGVDLVLMATHGRSGLSRAVLGSVAGRVLRSAPVPVVLLGPRAAEA